MSGPEVALFGLGFWGTSHWIPSLLSAMDAVSFRACLVDISGSVPPGIRQYVEDDRLRYLPWRRAAGLEKLEGAIICTTAASHAMVGRLLASREAPPKWILCEKPGGDSHEEFRELRDCCLQKDIDLGFVDHYLLKSDVRKVLGSPDGLHTLENATSVEFTMLETQSAGPRGEPANVVMLVHGLNLLHALGPKSLLKPTGALFARATEDAYEEVTYVHVAGKLALSGSEIPVTLEAGKQMHHIEKAIRLKYSSGRTLCVELGRGLPWSYRDTIVHAMSGHTPTEHSHGSVCVGVLDPELMDQVWGELERIAYTASGEVATYQPGEPLSRLHSLIAHPREA